MITDEARAKYLREPDRCPFCGEVNMLTRDVGQLTSDCATNQLQHELVCMECGAQWLDTWTAMRVEEWAQ